MPQYTEGFSEVHQALDYAIYQVLSPGAHYTPYVNVSEFHRVFAHWYVGNMGPGAYVLVTPEEATDAAGTNTQWLPWYWTMADIAFGDQMTHHALEIRTARMSYGYEYVALAIYVYDNPIEFTSWTWGVCPRHAIVPTTFFHEIATT